MYTPGNILYFTPFFFKNLAQPKPKYFVVLHNDTAGFILASLPTRGNHIPDDLKQHGCIRCDRRQIICYHIPKNHPVTDDGFTFPMDTYMYGKELNDYNEGVFRERYGRSDITLIGKLTTHEFSAIKTCFRNSPEVKRKYKKYL